MCVFPVFKYNLFAFDQVNAARIATASRLQIITVAIKKPRPIRILNIGLFTFFITTEEKIIASALIAPPIAPPTMGNILHRYTEFPQVRTNIGIMSARMYSYHFMGGAMVIFCPSTIRLAPKNMLPFTVT